MKAVFVELPAFERYRDRYLDDASFRLLQETLIAHPEAGDLIEGAGGLRMVRFADARRAKGKRGGSRVIYYYWIAGSEFWLFTVYNKDEMADLTARQRSGLKDLVKSEWQARRKS